MKKFIKRNGYPIYYNDDLSRKENFNNYNNENNKEIKETIEDTYRGPEERIVIYRDLDNRGEVYGRKYLFDRFKLNFTMMVFISMQKRF